MRINLYNNDIEIDPGIYTYKLTYFVHQPNLLKNRLLWRDRLTWNVTGEEWSFPIDKASAVVHFHDRISSNRIHIDAFTGNKAENTKSYEEYIDEEGNARFVTTRPLNVGEGFGINVTFPIGLVRTPFLVEILLILSMLLLPFLLPFFAVMEAIKEGKLLTMAIGTIVLVGIIAYLYGLSIISVVISLNIIGFIVFLLKDSNGSYSGGYSGSGSFGGYSGGGSGGGGFGGGSGSGGGGFGGGSGSGGGGGA